MFYGVKIEYGAQNWQVFQRKDGEAHVTLGGIYRLEDGAARAGVRSATPVLRVMNEWDNAVVLPWTKADAVEGDSLSGEWRTTLTLPQGDSYRVECSLDAVSAASGEHWMFRGDIRTHLGVGDVFCIAGQSNAAGYGRGLAVDPPDMRVRLYRNSGRWDVATHPMNDATDAADCPNAPMSVTGVSPYLSFGRTYAALSGTPVGLVASAQGGSPISAWEPLGTDTLRKNMLAKLGQVGGCRAILWYQGCADAVEGACEGYADAFERFVSATRHDLGFDVPVFTCQLNQYSRQPDGARWARVRETQRRMARTLKDVHVMSTAGIDMLDEIHNSAAGNVQLGERIARQCAGALCGTESFNPPDVEEITRSDEGLCVRFANVRGNLVCRATTPEFSVEDALGSVGVRGVRFTRCQAHIALDRALIGKACLSYGALPTQPTDPICDDRTWLPALAFDHVEVR